MASGNQHPLSSRTDSAVYDLAYRIKELSSGVSGVKSDISGIKSSINTINTNINNIKSSYLPLSGGTLTGDLNIKNGNSKIWSDGDLLLGSANGALIRLRPTTDTTEPGGFQIRASNGSSSKYLIGYVNGGLTWENKPLAIYPGMIYAFNGICHGHITSSSQEIVFSITLTLPILATSVKFNGDPWICIRCVNGGYVNSTYTSDSKLSKFTLVTPSFAVRQGSIRITLTRSSKWTNTMDYTDTSGTVVLNNTPLSVDFNGELLFS